MDVDDCLACVLGQLQAHILFYLQNEKGGRSGELDSSDPAVPRQVPAVDSWAPATVKIRGLISWALIYSEQAAPAILMSRRTPTVYMFITCLYSYMFSVQ